VSQGSDARCLVKDYVPFLTYVLPASAWGFTIILEQQILNEF
jgi:hypothetical protein